MGNTAVDRHILIIDDNPTKNIIIESNENFTLLKNMFMTNYLITILGENQSKNLPMIPVLQMMEHCKMSCGADSRKASKVLELNISFWMRAIVFSLEGRLVSKK